MEPKHENSPQVEDAQATSGAADLDSDILEADIEEELLVEEISIDGMCGVY